ncbi:MAG TPA: MiaB/RimO family radical SAM methylthiotransferase [Anaerolineae bacterium]|nr:MiaB/RimO family radical SAM methylthiotransferase [Anaerolineae bacterium]
MKIHLDSIGCRLNQSEIEHMAWEFRQAGHELVPSSQGSDLVVINTCTVTAAAASDSRAHARRAHRNNPSAEIVLTGCWSSLEPSKAAALPGVKHVIPNASKHRLVPDLLGKRSLKLDPEAGLRHPVPGPRRRTRAFIKAQDGCDAHCTYCIATIARGGARSTPLEAVIEEVRSAAASGAQEAVLTGVQLSAYGLDLQNGLNISSLVRSVLAETRIPRLRLSSLEPWGLPDGFWGLWSDKRLCRHVHLPLQSGCEQTLRRMGRPITPVAYAELLKKARNAIPDLSVTTDLIVGFPGEDEKAFQISLDFVAAMAFSGAHVFSYSPRPGTSATRLPAHVSHKVARDRSLQMRRIVERSRLAHLEDLVGRQQEVLWERATENGNGTWDLQGLSDAYWRVRARADADLSNRISSVRFTGFEGGELFGELA